MTMTLEKSRKLALSTVIGSNRRQRKCCGVLHTRLTRFLPEFIDDGDKFANLRRISIAMNMSYQGIYKWMKPNRPNRIRPEIARTLVELSQMTDRKSPKVPKDWEPATIEDFWEFVAS